jgi:hypothetical protein
MREARSKLKKTDLFGSDQEREMPFTDDSSEDENYLESAMAKELWKVREITRIKKFKDAKTKWENELAEVQRRRNLTEE